MYHIIGDIQGYAEDLEGLKKNSATRKNLEPSNTLKQKLFLSMTL